MSTRLSWVCSTGHKTTENACVHMWCSCERILAASRRWIAAPTHQGIKVNKVESLGCSSADKWWETLDRDLWNSALVAKASSTRPCCGWLRHLLEAKTICPLCECTCTTHSVCEATAEPPAVFVRCT